ncbi:patatin-like phospholipase family protein [bacterium]|nr:patatin-like phospholipase family protein [bacterium]
MGKVRRVAVLSGGGSRGCFQVGFLYGLFHQQPESPDFNFDGWVGVSTGALQASWMGHWLPGTPENFTLQQKASAQSLKAIWLALEGNSSIFDSWRNNLWTWTLRKIVPKLSPDMKDLAMAVLRRKPAVYDNTPLHELLKEHLQNARWHPGTTFVGVTDYRSGDYQDIELKAEEAIPNILASTAIPIVFPGVDASFDGGVRNMTPLRKGVQLLLSEGQAPDVDYELYVMLTCPRGVPATEEKYEHIVDVAKRTYEIIMDEMFVEDLKEAARVNRLVEFLDSMQKMNPHLDVPEEYAKYVKLKIYLIEPRADMVPKDSKKFHPDEMRHGIECGEQMAKDFIQNPARFLFA